MCVCVCVCEGRPGGLKADAPVTVKFPANILFERSAGRERSVLTWIIQDSKQRRNQKLFLSSLASLFENPVQSSENSRRKCCVSKWSVDFRLFQNLWPPCRLFLGFVVWSPCYHTSSALRWSDHFVQLQSISWEFRGVMWGDNMSAVPMMWLP